MVPVIGAVADAINSVLYLAEGQYMLVAASAACIFVGDTILKGAKYADEAIDVGFRLTDDIVKAGVKSSDEIIEAGVKGAVKNGSEEVVERAGKEVAEEIGKPDENIVYRALNPKDAERLSQGLGLEAKNPEGTWNLDEHLIGGSGKASWANDPFISTTTDIDVARGFNQSGSNLGIVKIDLNKVSS